jgi:uncharacterized SAM-binding protein YcdF (DUF218 family)
MSKPGSRAGMLIGLAAFLGGCASAISRPLLLPEEPLFPAEAIVVLGYGPPVEKDGSLKPELKRRVAQGVKLYEQGLAPALVMTGGNTYADYYEADVMRDLAAALGVPEAAILREREAFDTITNARDTVALLCQGREPETCAPEVILVSSPYHLKRGKMLFECAGARVQTSGCAVPAGRGYRIGFSLYESNVRLQYLFVDECALARGEKGEAWARKIQGLVRARSRVMEP